MNEKKSLYILRNGIRNFLAEVDLPWKKKEKVRSILKKGSLVSQLYKEEKSTCVALI